MYKASLVQLLRLKRLRVSWCSRLLGRYVSSEMRYEGCGSALRPWTHPRRTRAPKLPLQSTLKLARERRPIRVRRLDDVADAQEGGDEGCDLDEALARADPGVLVRREDAHLVVVLVAGLAIVPPLLLVPPVAVGVAELSLDWGGLDVASVLFDTVSPVVSTLAGSDVFLPKPAARASSHIPVVPSWSLTPRLPTSSSLPF